MASTKSRLHRLFKVDAAIHGGEDEIDQTSNINLEVINLGLSRTGTTSLDLALEKLGYGPGHQGVDLYKRPPHRDAWTAFIRDLNSSSLSERPDVLNTRLRNLTRGWRHAGDGPINFLVAESLAAYPDAKFILTVRDGANGGADSWFASFDAAMGVQWRKDWSRTVFRSLISSVGFIRKMDDFVQVHRKQIEKDLGADYGLEWYTRHNARVERLIPKKQLLVFNVKEGWGPLCEFLGKEEPDEEFPRVNELDSMRMIYFMMQVFGLCTWLFYLGLVAVMVLVAVRPGTVLGAVRGLARSIYPSSGC